MTRTKRMLAFVLAGTMTFGMGLTAFAADTTPVTSGGGTGAGELEGHVDKSVLSVTLPTDSDTTTFKYTIDPEGLIAETQAAKYPGTTYASDTGEYFQTSDKNYTDKSAKLKVTNVGSVDADVTVAVSVAENSGITAMKASNGFTEGGAEELYLGLLVNTGAAEAVTGFGDSGKLSKTVGLKGRPANFEVQYKDSKYVYAAKDGVADTAWNSFEFGLEGACNKKGDYSADNFAVPTVTVTWSYKEHPANGGADMLPENATDEAGPSIDDSSLSMTAGQAFEVPVNLGVGSLKATGIASVSFERDGSDVTVGESRYTFADNKITFESSWVDSQLAGFTTSRTYKIVFNDTANTEVTFTITK